ncbi:hypothetical protein [Lonsdalea quercina]|uniref:hypothetical protein n=1 Tax=Lonsdalea quercina TaxID=71657 RepID=UPI0039752C80
MNKFIKYVAISLAASLPLTAAGEEPQWLEGIFVNQDKNALAKSLTFCPAGQALYDFVRAAYVVEGKDDGRVITLYSNGAFRIKVSDNGNELLPDDDFTEKWLTSSSLKRDPSQHYECKPRF